MFKKRRWVSFLLAAFLFCGCFTVPLDADAAVVTKKQKTYDIAVVFDNSGSMYRDQSWCRAKYAMEIFASMLNYSNGDTLKIFPMWEITNDGSEPKSGGSYEGFEIKSAQDIDKISQLYTVNPLNTPYEPIQEAHEYLKGSTKSDKWLVILTDGAFNERKRGEQDKINLKKELPELASDDINIQYLGFGEAEPLKSNPDKNFYAKKSSAKSLKDDLVSICNAIFQRSAVSKDKLDGNKLQLDLSMRNLIVFVQGDNAKINTLHNSDGEEIGILFDSGQRKFSKVKAKGYKDAPVDDSLAGQVVSFAACPKGEYTLDYSGADSIQIFYEPDVDIKLEFTDLDGKEIDLNDTTIETGEYRLNYGIVDNITGEDATESGLLGDVDLRAWVVKGDNKATKIDENGKVTLNPGESIYFKVEGTYLKDYKITTEDNKDAYTIKVEYPPEKELDITAEVQQKNSWYKQADHESWKPINVAVRADGKPLTDEEMAKLEWNIKCKDEITYHTEIVPGESALNIFVGYDENGKFVKPDNGKYKFEIEATAKDEFDRSQKDDDVAKFEVQSYSSIGKWLRWIIPIAVLLLAFLTFMSKKVMPKNITSENESFTVKGRSIDPPGEAFLNRKGKYLEIMSADVPRNPDSICGVTLQLKPIDRRWTGTKSRRVQITNIHAESGVKNITIGSELYEKDKKTDKWYNVGAPEAEITQDILNENILITADKSYFSCQLIHK